MIATDCPKCGQAVAPFARSCPHCGAPNGARVAVLAVAAALAILIIAVALAAVVVLRGQRVPVADEQPAPTTSDDFGWLSAAMNECDVEADKAPGTLPFLVIPLASASTDDTEWRAKSLNDIGNAILLPSDGALDALRSGMLKVSTNQYVFSIRDQATSTIYKWSPSVGVKKFSTADADAIENFTIQFQAGDKTNDANWGAAFVRRKGTCYWVYAIIGK